MSFIAMADENKFEAVTPAEAARLMAHMNQGHADSLSYMLEHYGNIQDAANPVMTAYTSDAMTIEYGKLAARKQYVYAFEPKVGAGEGRKRLVGMHTASKEAIGLSDVTINHLVLPPSLLLTILALALLQLAVLLAPPSTLLRYAAFAAPYVDSYQRAAGLTPTRASVANGIRWCLLAPLVVPHLIEAVACARPLLRRFNTSSRAVRWAYYVLTAVCGFPVWRTLRLEGERQERKLKAEKAKGGHSH